MAKKRYTFLMFREYETQAFAEHLERMAEKGWFLSAVHLNWIQCFEKAEPRKLNFSVVVLPLDSEHDSEYREDAMQLRELCKEAGWHCQYGGVMWQVFYTEAEHPVPIETDLGLQLEIQKKISLSAWRLLWYLCLGFLVFQQISHLLQYPEPEYLMVTRILNFVLFFLLCIVIVSRSIFTLLWYRRAKQTLVRTGSIPVVTLQTVKRRDARFLMSVICLLAAAILNVAVSLA